MSMDLWSTRAEVERRAELARQEGYEAGYNAGYEVGYEAGQWGEWEDA